MLLVTFEYDQNRIAGPPFAVLEHEVRALYAPAFTVEHLERRPAADLAARFKDLGEGAVHEAIYRITRT
jgi:thiopurine S-methyltransferase